MSKASPSNAETAPAAAAPSPLVAVYHRGGKGFGTFSHGPHSISPGETVEVPPEVADLWRSHKVGGIFPIVLSSELGAIAPGPPAAVVAALSSENQTLKDRLANLEKMYGEIAGLAGDAPATLEASLIAAVKAHQNAQALAKEAAEAPPPVEKKPKKS